MTHVHVLIEDFPSLYFDHYSGSVEEMGSCTFYCVECDKEFKEVPTDEEFTWLLKETKNGEALE